MVRPMVAGIVGTLLVATSCIIQGGAIEEIDPAARSDSGTTLVLSPMKAFLVDGSTVVYVTGANVTTDSIVGPGRRYSLGMRDTLDVRTVALDSIVGIEAFDGEVDAAATVLATVGLGGLAVVGTIALLKAIFGSCPTFYASAEQGGALQAEGFSYSIAPLLESRDLDVTGIGPDSDGVVRLELRNEALETHYLNHLELVAVDHAPGTRLVSDERERPMGVTDEVRPLSAFDRGGRDVRGTLSSTDDWDYASDPQRIAATTAADTHDWIELTFPAPPSDSAVVTLRLRNSLLTTVLLYDLMLGRAGARAIDWVGRDMTRISTVVELGRWFGDAMGLQVEVFDGSSWIMAGRVPDTGPIAWEDVGVRVPVLERDAVRIRLRFFTDAWRLDRVALGTESAVASPVRIPVARVRPSDTSFAGEMLARLGRPDERYLVTYPGTSALLEFDPPPAVQGSDRSFFLSSQGYYTEWVRPQWIREGEGQAFRPAEALVTELMALWTAQKTQLESDFHDARIPVR